MFKGFIDLEYYIAILNFLKSLVINQTRTSLKITISRLPKFKFLKRALKFILKTKKSHNTWKQEKGTAFALGKAPGDFATAVATFTEIEVCELEDSDCIPSVT